MGFGTHLGHIQRRDGRHPGGDVSEVTLTYSVVEAEGMRVIGGDTHRQCWDGRQ